ncbi:50S ribosomal protein L24 [Candidatus Dojkabacteria bacterium]|uniref:Large ribosomal subunit protein uL24 n=1 Tax=Candidatus Dojkabacteria bacterium TaxID=2099670 RepID=A0A955L8A7_9BACT|nr:50S ribosomal protein L24 [Candidatus Dojkabacteria bacterium]
MKKVLEKDTVKILSGKDRGKTGEVLKLLKNEDKVLVKGVNVVTRHRKAQANGTKAGIIKEERPIHISNVQVINPKNGKPSRVGFEVKEGKKIRVFKNDAAPKTAKKSKTTKK